MFGRRHRGGPNATPCIRNAPPARVGVVEKGAVSVHRGRTCALPPTGASYESQDAALNQWWGRCPPLVPSHLHELLSRLPLFRSTNFPHHSVPPPSPVFLHLLFFLHIYSAHLVLSFSIFPTDLRFPIAKWRFFFNFFFLFDILLLRKERRNRQTDRQIDCF